MIGVGGSHISLPLGVTAFHHSRSTSHDYGKNDNRETICLVLKWCPTLSCAVNLDRRAHFSAVCFTPPQTLLVNSYSTAIKTRSRSKWQNVYLWLTRGKRTAVIWNHFGVLNLCLCTVFSKTKGLQHNWKWFPAIMHHWSGGKKSSLVFLNLREQFISV